jgi:hypothetical protein
LDYDNNKYHPIYLNYKFHLMMIFYWIHNPNILNSSSFLFHLNLIIYFFYNVNVLN